MEDKNVFDLAKDPNFVPGIYNYCDRWCERCHLTEKCLVYAMEKDEMDKLATYELVDEAYWRKLLSNLDNIITRLKRDFKKAGLDFGQNRYVSGEATRARETSKSHPLALAAKGYSSIVKTWMGDARAHFKEKIDELHERVNLGLDEQQVTEESDTIIDAIDVIIWYQHEIRAKLQRALTQRSMPVDVIEHNQARDYDGSAKVALIGIDKSIHAWNTLREQLPDKSDDILTFLANLERLRKNTEKRFPQARYFKRPGFDD